MTLLRMIALAVLLFTGRASAIDEQILAKFGDDPNATNISLELNDFQNASGSGSATFGGSELEIEWTRDGNGDIRIYLPPSEDWHIALEDCTHPITSGGTAWLNVGPPAQAGHWSHIP